MKKLLITTMLLLSSCSVFANVGFQDSIKKSTVAEALKMNDNTYVMVQGNIEKRISDDKYSFKDSTGSITVEIDDDKWNGLMVNSSDLLELKGEIEKKFNSVKLDVDSVVKVNK